MKLYGLIGHPLGHSFSASYFNEKFEREGIDARYDNIDIADIASFPEVVATHPNLCGLNVTIPHKVNVIPFLDELTQTASEIGAVNTIRVEHRDTGLRLIGHNTDSPAFEQTLMPLLKPYHSTALLLGATGGASKAVRYALQRLGIVVMGVSRKATSDTITYQDIDEQLMSKAKLIVNTTPLGMFPNTENAPDIPYQYLTTEHLCYDLVYNPEETLFLKQAKDKCAVTINGLPMLHRQADLAWQFWNP